MNIKIQNGITNIGLVDERVETIPALVFFKAISMAVTPTNGQKKDPIISHLKAFLFFISPHFPLDRYKGL